MRSRGTSRSKGILQERVAVSEAALQQGVGHGAKLGS